MLRILGAKLSDPEDLKVTIDIQNVLQEPILVVVDTSRIIILIRNCLGDLKILYTEDGDSIEWRYMEQLHNVQSEEHLHLGNRLRKNNILFQKFIWRPSGKESSSIKRKTDNRVVSGSRKRGFLGFLINLKSYETLFNTYVEDKNLLSFILGHKLSQDHLEMFFGAIRSSLGLNNNPTISLNLRTGNWL